MQLTYYRTNVFFYLLKKIFNGKMFISKHSNSDRTHCEELYKYICVCPLFLLTFIIFYFNIFPSNSHLIKVSCHNYSINHKCSAHYKITTHNIKSIIIFNISFNQRLLTICKQFIFINKTRQGIFKVMNFMKVMKNTVMKSSKFS